MIASHDGTRLNPRKRHKK